MNMFYLIMGAMIMFVLNVVTLSGGSGGMDYFKTYML